MPSIISDLTVDSGISKQYNRLLELQFGQIDRSFFVGGLTGVAPVLVQSVAEAFVKSFVPLGTPHPADPLCLARYYSVKSDQSTDAVRVVVSYVYQLIQLEWTVEADNYLELVETDVQYDGGGNLVPIKIDNFVLNWLNQSDPKPGDLPEATCYGTVQVLRPRKRWVYTVNLPTEQAAENFNDAATGQIGNVNSGSWNGCGDSTVLVMDAGVIFNFFQGQYLARCELVYRPEGWNPWARWSNTNLGVPPNLWRASNGAAANGMVQATEYLKTDIDNSLLALI